MHYGLDHVRTCHEHVAGLIHHNRKVGDGWRVDSPASARPQNSGICGTTPDASVLRRKMSAYPASDATPSWMRAPPESFRPMMGAPTFNAQSITLQIFAALASLREPPKTVKSWAKA